MQHSSEEEGLLLHFLDCVMTECVTMKTNVLLERLEVAGRVRRRKRRKKSADLFPLWSSNIHDKQSKTLKRNEAFPVQNTKWFAHT